MSLQRQATAGAAWSIATGLGTRLLGLAGTVALTHWLDPALIGEVENAAVLVVTASGFSNLGLAQYLVANPKSGRAVAFHVTLFQLLFALFALAVAVAVAGPLGGLVKTPAMVRYVVPLAVALLIERIGLVPWTLLMRDLRFRRLGLIRSLGEVAFTTVAVALAATGSGGMAIVWANLVRYGLTTTLFVSSVKSSEWLRPAPLDRATTRTLLAYGLPLWVASITGFGSRRWDNSIVSALFGPQVAGLYKQAYNLADIPATQVGEQLGEVLLPSFSRLDPARRPAALLRATGLIALLITPLAIGLGAVAPTLTRAILPPAWSGVAPLLVALSVLSVVRPIGWTIGAYLQAVGRTRPVMALEVARLLLLLLAIATLGRWGPLWVCVAVGLAFGAQALLAALVVRGPELPLHRFAAALGRPLLASVPMVLAVLAVRAALLRLGLGGRLLPLVVEIAVGALAYVPAALLVAPQSARDLVGLGRGLLRRRRDGDGAGDASD